MSKKKLTYIIDICTFLPRSGGICALHQLCHDLNSLGEEAYVTSPITHPTLNAPYVGNKKFKKDEIVVIYPEITQGNPLNAKNVIRWVLYHVSHDFCDKNPPSDVYFKWSSIYKLKDESRSSGILITTFSDKLNCFYDPKEPRKGTAFLIKKDGMKQQLHPDDSLDLHGYQDNIEVMASIFRKIKYFYCYDSACYWACLATLCGCVSIVQPNSELTFEQWSKPSPETKYGIAYGIENLKHAEDTIHLVQENYSKVKQQEFETVKNFVKVCEKKFL